MDETEAKQAAFEVSTVLDSFLEGLHSRASRTEFQNILFGRMSLGEVDELGYKPEAYTRFNLIEPLLRAVGLEYQLEPRSSGVYRKRWPDFDITSTAIPYIGEVKAVNEVERGIEDIKEYLGIEGFISPYGILTDGVEWYVYGPPSDGGRTSNPVSRNHISLSDSLQSLALTQGYWDMDLLSKKIHQNGAKQIDRFPRTFRRDEIDVWALEKMPRKYRRDFLEENRSLQASLEGTWREH